jgi:hypothetical protein
MFHINFADFVEAIAKNVSDFTWAITKAAIIVVSSFGSIVGLAWMAFRKATPK